MLHIDISCVFSAALPGPLFSNGFFASNAAEVVGSLTPSRVDPLTFKKSFNLSKCL